MIEDDMAIALSLVRITYKYDTDEPPSHETTWTHASYKPSPRFGPLFRIVYETTYGLETWTFSSRKL